MADVTPVSFPLWVLIPGLVEDPAPNRECGDGELPLAFSSAERMVPYLSSRRAGDWLMRLVTAETLFLLNAELHNRASRGICLDPEPDGSGGIEIQLGELMKLA